MQELEIYKSIDDLRSNGETLTIGYVEKIGIVCIDKNGETKPFQNPLSLKSDFNGADLKVYSCRDFDIFYTGSIQQFRLVKKEDVEVTMYAKCVKDAVTSQACVRATRGVGSSNFFSTSANPDVLFALDDEDGFFECEVSSGNSGKSIGIKAVRSVDVVSFKLT